MELHIQKCQNCGSRDLRNILARAEQQKVFVQCRQCGELVARYILQSGGYYHAGKNFESFLRSMEREGDSSSGRDLQALFNEVQENAKSEFEDVITQIKARYTDGVP